MNKYIFLYGYELEILSKTISKILSFEEANVVKVAY